MARRPGTGMGPVRGQIGMDSRQHFRSGRPCPVCGGHAGMPRGEAVLSSQPVQEALQEVAGHDTPAGVGCVLGPAGDGLPGRATVLIEPSAQAAVRLHVVAPVVQASGHAPSHSRTVWRHVAAPKLRGQSLSRTETAPFPSVILAPVCFPLILYPRSLVSLTHTRTPGALVYRGMLRRIEQVTDGTMAGFSPISFRGPISPSCLGRWYTGGYS